MICLRLVFCLRLAVLGRYDASNTTRISWYLDTLKMKISIRHNVNLPRNHTKGWTNNVRRTFKPVLAALEIRVHRKNTFVCGPIICTPIFLSQRNVRTKRVELLAPSSAASTPLSAHTEPSTTPTKRRGHLRQRHVSKPHFAQCLSRAIRVPTDLFVQNAESKSELSTTVPFAVMPETSKSSTVFGNAV